LHDTHDTNDTHDTAQALKQISMATQFSVWLKSRAILVYVRVRLPAREIYLHIYPIIGHYIRAQYTTGTNFFLSHN
jgi:hypothetical protein